MSPLKNIVHRSVLLFSPIMAPLHETSSSMLPLRMDQQVALDHFQSSITHFSQFAVSENFHLFLQLLVMITSLGFFNWRLRLVISVPATMFKSLTTRAVNIQLRISSQTLSTTVERCQSLFLQMRLASSLTMLSKKSVVSQIGSVIIILGIIIPAPVVRNTGWLSATYLHS